MVIIEEYKGKMITRINNKILGEYEAPIGFDNQITISNISGASNWDTVCNYSLEVDDHQVCQFEHLRKFGDLSQCLLDAADALSNINGDDFIVRVLKDSAQAVIDKKERDIIDLMLAMHKMESQFKKF